MAFFPFLLFIGVLSTTAATHHKSNTHFDGFQVHRLYVNPEDTSVLQATFDSLSIVELNHGRGKNNTSTLDLAIPPSHVEAFRALNLTTTILSDNLGMDIAAEGPLQDYPEFDADGVPSLSWFDAYHAYEDHIRFWSDLQASFPNNSELIQAGQSFEGRPIQGIHLWGSGGRNSKPAVFFNGNVHAREWITSMVSPLHPLIDYCPVPLCRFIDVDFVGYENDTAVRTALDNYDFYVLPVVNPDGFVYSQTDNRLWRKNRQKRENTTEIGTDINRNWSVGFGGDGSSSNPGSETFSGYSPGDAPETAALMKFAQTLAADKGIKLYIDWHSYAQVILLSYGYTCDSFPENIDQQISLARETSARIAQSYNTTFDYGPGCLVLYQSSGNGRDYMTDAAGTEFGWGIELRSTSYGFVLPADQILPSSIEIWEGMKYLWANM
ncbi:uncharacterized protein F4822DRAFT_444500 [Hypoxylon trugodes]|uniref:uncharacterized protein n=1 Tax=Hypoxylon trugodes TaxID=326681 RepID=UPI00219D2090|nr:uncharacterized protein F4822DRAFT_444500 [Hypoxylon trugodes]KAI1388037.1 hypothetical protein F4822DRAFT_444500 [Hypoxylon trugodes]